MKFAVDKKETIKQYLLEKISQHTPSVSKLVAEVFEVNPSTVHSYINELEQENVIRRIKRGEYELITRSFTYDLSRANGDLDSDTYAYDKCMEEHIKNLDKNVIDIWYYVFSEMTNNVMDHSLAEHARVIIEQDVLTTRAYIIDDGIGIFRKIQEYFKLDSLDDAIGELFKGKTTTDSKNHSGEGIFFSSKLMDEFIIISAGKVFTHNKYDDSMIADITPYEISGTCVYMSLSNHSNKTAKEVFDRFADVDEGFFKTQIPVKNIFDTSPVSRSQARRLCNRLDKFKEVIFDFDGVSWMGQGFAHQLFVIFAGNNPEIKLTPVNMNEAVTAMYRHVVSTSGK